MADRLLVTVKAFFVFVFDLSTVRFIPLLVHTVIARTSMITELQRRRLAAAVFF